MSRLQSIESGLASINEAAFQELCDSFLILRNSNYAAYSRTGTVAGKQKTKKGTPDSFLLLPDGRYIFVEHSTNSSAGVSKLKGDIEKCIDVDKTGIPLDQILEIILCINFNLTPSEVEELKNLLIDTRIRLTLHTLDSLALEIYLNHRDLAKDYLGLPLDTGQIVSLDKFILEYGRASKGIATPLDNTFLHRETELKEMKASLAHGDFIILTGPPGVGKTKMAIEGIQEFIGENPSFAAYAVSYKHYTLLEDLYQYLDPKKDYILFVDDANRIDAFGQITGFYRADRPGKLKIVITVRDYAFQHIGLLCHDFDPKRMDITKLSDEQLVDIVKAEPLKILNPDYHKPILHIADGNPRLAIMTAQLAIAEQDIRALVDISELFENYFTTFIKDDGQFSKPFNIQCLGLIAFFFAVPYKDKDLTESILSNFGMGYKAFIEAIDTLDKLELVEIQFEHVKVPEQNLSTYFFYKCFIQENLLSFKTLLEKYFEENSERFRDCVIPANNTFGPERVMEKLLPHLRDYLDLVKVDQEKSFKFLKTFWYYLPDETLAFLYDTVRPLPENIPEEFPIAYENNDFAFNKNDTLSLLSDFFRYTNKLKDALSLAFEFCRKKPEHLPELLYHIRERLTFDRDDEPYGFMRQRILFQFLFEGVKNGDLAISTAFYELSKTFMAFYFQQTKGGRNRSIVFYNYPIPGSDTIKQFRKEVWKMLDDHFMAFPKKSLNVLRSYGAPLPDTVKELMQYDLPFIIDIINKNLNKDVFDHSKVVQELIRWVRRNDLDHPDFPGLQKTFTNSTYELFLKLDWDRLRDKEIYEFDDYNEYERLKEEEIRSSFVFLSKDEVEKFYTDFVHVKNTSKNAWNYPRTLDFIIDENSGKNFELGCYLLTIIINHNNEVDYTPFITFRKHLITKEKADQIWEVIQERDFKNKTYWELSFYDYLDDALISKTYFNHFLNTLQNIKDRTQISFSNLERFQRVEPDMFEIVLRIMVDKIAKEKVPITVWVDFFEKHIDNLENDLKVIKEFYIQQDQLQNHFDYRGKGFVKILKKDQHFLLEYVDSQIEDGKQRLNHENKQLEFIWEIDTIEPVLAKVFDLVTEKEPYFGILPHFCNAFFWNLSGDAKTRAKAFLLGYCRANYDDVKKVNTLVDISRNSMKDIFNDILLLYLSLNQKVEAFAQIWWRGNGGVYSGDIIMGDIEATDWRNILSVVETSELGFELLPIKKYINDRIQGSLKSGDWERRRRFLEKF